MSRIVVFGLDNVSLGEFRAEFSRGYGIVDANTGGGMSSTIVIPDEIALQPWMQLGRMVYIEHDRLPAWAGMIDTPWDCVSPVKAAIYNADYLLTLRTPEKKRKLTGNASALAAALLAEANKLEEMYVRPGLFVDVSGASHEYPLDARNLYTQFLAAAARCGAEVLLRPERDESNRLVIYFDLYDQCGVDTNFLLHDGRNGNITITAAKVDRSIINRVLGTNGAQTPLFSLPQSEPDSIETFRLRNILASFSGVKDIATLTRNARARLAANAYPRLLIDAEIHDVGDAWLAARPGNTVSVQAANIYPPGMKGWRGDMRMRTINYDEKQNVLTTQLEAVYYG